MRFLSALAVVAQLVPFARAQGSVKTFQFALTQDDYSQDGTTREMILINGASPGPVIEVDQDDLVHIVVTNNAHENTTIHFHGIEMFRTPWSDGVPGVTQRSIQPGETFTYTWEATQYGSFWYHSHWRGHIEDGLYGAIVIHPRAGDPKPFGLIAPNEIAELELAEDNVYPLIISDLTHLNSHDKWDYTLESAIEIVCYDSIVFNGKGSVQCLDSVDVTSHLTEIQEMYLETVPGAVMTDKACLPPVVMNAILGGGGDPALMPAGIYEGCTPTVGQLEIIETAQNQWIALDLIGANNFIIATVSIDEHDMWVYAIDGLYIEPQLVQALVLNNGDRVSVMVKTTTAGDFKIRTHASTPPQMLVGHAVLSVGGVGVTVVDSVPHIDLVGGPLDETCNYLDYASASPYVEETIPLEADDFFLFNMKVDGASYLWALNNARLMPHDIDTVVLPALFDPQPNIQSDVIISTLNNTWVDLVFVSAQVPMPPHPIHKHGNKMYHIGSGVGEFTWASVNEAIQDAPHLFNLDNPPKKDAVMTPPAEATAAWAAVRYHVTDPGPWLIHCHIHNHVEGGMLVLIQDGVDAWPDVPQQYWDALA